MTWLQILFWPVAGIVVGFAWVYSEIQREKFLNEDDLTRKHHDTN